MDKVNYNGIVGYHYSLGKKTLNNNTRTYYHHDQAKHFEQTTERDDFYSDFYYSKIASPQSEKRDDSTFINEDYCYCSGECSPHGLINITACRYGAPGFISLPHFNKADPVLVNQVNGLNPDNSKHSFDIILEPVLLI